MALSTGAFLLNLHYQLILLPWSPSIPIIISSIMFLIHLNLFLHFPSLDVLILTGPWKIWLASYRRRWEKWHLACTTCSTDLCHLPLFKHLHIFFSFLMMHATKPLQSIMTHWYQPPYFCAWVEFDHIVVRMLLMVSMLQILPLLKQVVPSLLNMWTISLPISLLHLFPPFHFSHTCSSLKARFEPGGVSVLLSVCSRLTVCLSHLQYPT